MRKAVSDVDDLERHPLGRTGLSLTWLGFGAAPLGNLWTAISDADAHAALEAAWSAGIRYFDTAPWYGIGLSEHRLGTFLRSKPRDSYVVSTKVGRILRPWPARYGRRINRGPWTAPLDFEVRFDYTYDGIVRSFEDSLQRLGLPEVDMLLIHDLDRSYHSPEWRYQARLDQLANGGMAALRDLRAEGCISAIGAGINGPGVIPHLLDAADGDLDFFLVAGPYSLLDQEILDTELERCRHEGVEVVVGAPFHYGLLAMGTGDPDRLEAMGVDEPTLERVRRLEAACARAGVVLPAAALQFPAAHPAVRSVLFGADNGDQVAQTVGWFESPIPSSFWEELRAEGLLAAGAPVPGSP